MIIIDQILGHIGNVFFITGAIGFARKNTCGFYLNILGNIFYIFQSFLMNNLSLGLLSFVLIVINIVGILNWRNK